MWRSIATSTYANSTTSKMVDTPPSKQNVQTSFRRRPTPAPIPTPVSKTTLTEALKGNPFRSPTKPMYDRPPERTSFDENHIESLNHDLQIVADVYSDVKLEVLRELLVRFDGESRLEICTEQLVKFKSKWTRGQLLNPPRDTDTVLAIEDRFRRKPYIAVARRTLITEFSSLNKSVIEAVLAEVNQSYTRARPILKGIAAKSWRSAFTSFFRRKKDQDQAPSFLLDKNDQSYSLKRTGDDELDEELEMLFCAEPRNQQRQAREKSDIEMATALVIREAEAVNSLFECQVCYDEVPFEFIVTCTEDAHTICHECVKRSLHEALFGQGWAQSMDVAHGTLQCLAPGENDRCVGYIARDLLQRTIESTTSGTETWNKLEQRLATDNIIKSGLSITNCPFCFYAENSLIYTLTTAAAIRWRFKKQQLSLTIVLLFLLAELIAPTVLLILGVITLLCPGLLREFFYSSLINLHNRAQTQRFRCQNPACHRNSCLSCSKAWHDPHTCHEPLILSLRTAVEAARTAALKRTCPRCGTSFIKSSGCNKLTCVCGYAMCYLCRRNIGKVNESGAVDEREGGEGYRHFCEHFRPLPGQKCSECSKCDLYMNEDEEISVKKAGEEAEREWREKEGMVGVKDLKLEQAIGELGKLRTDDVLVSAWNRFITGDWTLQGVCDWMVAELIVVEN